MSVTVSAQLRPAVSDIEAIHPKYRPDIDGLRAVAILPVVAFHACPGLAPGGFVGVDVFFVISGYLISLIVFAGLHHGTFTFSTFYARRIRRIFPALILVLIACLGWGWLALFADDYALVGKHVAGGAGFVANLVLWNEAGYFDPASDTKPLLHLWSLGIEEQFYLMWPTLLFWSWKRRLNLLVVTGVVLVASFLFNAVQVRSDEIAAFYSPVTRLWELLLGAALAYTSALRVPGGSNGWLAAIVQTRGTSVPRNIMALAGLTFIMSAVVAFNVDTSFPGWRAGLPAGGALLVIAAGPTAWLNRRVLSQRVMVWIGLISYPLYLWHWPILSLARNAVSGEPSIAIRVAAVAASTALAWLTYALVERPVRFRSWSTASIAALCALMALTGAIGYVTFRSHGWIERPVNRSDRAHFLQYYERLQKKGLREAYRAECDFMDWDTEQTRSSISPDCTVPGERGTVLLWGDSYAQALSLGLRHVLPEGTRLAQITTSACAPRLREETPHAFGGRCTRANGYARDRIAALRPDVVVMAQISGHTATEWDELAAAVRSLGAQRVILVGPAPQWLPSLPLVITRHHWNQPVGRVAEGLNPEMFEIDRVLGSRLERSTELRYISLTSALCNEDGCVATVPGTDHQLIAVDKGHLSPAGSIYVAETIVGPWLTAR